MPIRQDFWDIPQPWGPIVIYSVMSITTIIMLWLWFRRINLLRYGVPVKWKDRLGLRFNNFLRDGLFQIGILRKRYPGFMHLLLSLSIFILFLGTIFATLNSHVYPFLKGNYYLVYKLILDVCSVLLVLGVGMAVYRRFVQKPKYLTTTRGAIIILLLIALIGVSGLLVESFRLAIQQPEWKSWSPVGGTLANIWQNLEVNQNILNNAYLFTYGIHLLSIVILMVTLPTGPMVHLLSAPLNIFISDPEHTMARLSPLQSRANGELIFSDGIKTLTQKQLLSALSCTNCGRCSEVCPAVLSGHLLDPQKIMLHIRESLDDVKGGSFSHPFDPQMMAQVWGCTTCGACENICPVHIEHLDIIVALRRALIQKGRINENLQKSLENMVSYGSSFGILTPIYQSWISELPFEIPDATKSSVDWLWFPGDITMRSPEYANISRMTATILHNAKINYGIFTNIENNSGNDIRRIGEEGLYDELVQRNLSLLQVGHYKGIFTTDPHTYNTLINEYPAKALMGKPVLHISQLLDQLILSNQIQFKNALGWRVTYHDPCYLGRYNKVYHPARHVLQATGCELIEMPRNKDFALCCGAGGGRFWMEEGALTERSSEMRLLEAAALQSVSRFITTCPKCYIYFSEASRSINLNETLHVADLVEVVHAAMKS